MIRSILTVAVSVLCIGTLAAQPNVILITLDTTRADHVGFSGGKPGVTPVMDELAAKGVVFEEARAHVPLTLPSHANILAGKDPSALNLRVNGLVLNEKHRMLQEVFKAAGYRTVAVVSSVVLEKTRGLARGFDVYNDKMTKLPRGGGPPEERRAEDTTDAAIAEMEKVQGPYFLWVHYYDPHYDYAAPQPFGAKFKDSPYDGEIAYMDAEIGRLLKALGEKGRLKDTAVVIVGDHGEGLMDHGERQHGVFLYEYALKVPLLFVFEGKLEKGKRDGFFCGLADVAPTIAALAGLKLAGAKGQDLFGSGRAERPLYIETYHGYFNYGWAPLRGMTDRGYKFIDAPRPELYRYRESEKDNLHSRNPDVVSRMRKELEKYPGADEGERKELEDFLKDPSNAENLRQLMSLGYLSGEGMRPSQPGLVDPKDGIAMEEEIRKAQEVRDGGNLQGAKEMLLSVLKRNPTNVPALSILGGIYLHENKLDEAKLCYQEQIRIKPQMDGAHMNLGTVYKRKGDLAAAEKEYRAALAVNPKMSEAVANLSKMLIDQKRFKEAKDILEKAISDQVENSDVYFEAGILYAMESNFERARFCFSKSVSLDPLRHEALANLGKIAFKAGKFDEAIAYYERAVRIAPGNAEYHATLGSLYLNGKNDAEKAVHYYRKAIAADPYGRMAQELRAMVQGLEAERKGK